MAQQRLAASRTAILYRKYQTDPIGFIRDILGEHLTDDQIKVVESVKDNPVTIARSANAIGKSHSAARACIWFYTVFDTAKVYLTAAPPLENLKNILWGEIMSVVQRKADMFKGHTIKRLGVWRDANSFMTGLAIPTTGTPEEKEAKFSGKHAPYMLFVVDEGDAVPDEIYKGIESCMSGGHVRLLVLFNPRAQVGPVYLKEKNREANVVELSAFNHPNVLTGQDVIPGAVTRDITVRRINEWTRALAAEEKPDYHTFEVPQFLEGQTAQAMDGTIYPPLMGGHRKVIYPQFAYMVLGKYPAQGAKQLIDDSWIDRAVMRWHDYVAHFGEIPPAGIQPIMGVDLAEFGTDNNVVALRYDGYVPRFTFWPGIDPDLSASKAMQFYIQNDASIAMIDATGIGSNVAPAMVRRAREREQAENKVYDLRAVSVKVGEKPSPIIKSEMGEFRYLRDQLWWALARWLEKDKLAMIPPDGLLLEELRAVEYEIPKKIQVTDKEHLRKRLKRSPDRADALCLTFAPFERAKWLRASDATQNESKFDNNMAAASAT